MQQTQEEFPWLEARFWERDCLTLPEHKIFRDIANYKGEFYCSVHDRYEELRK